MPKEPLLIAHFAVSRTVFREAIKTLSSKGLLESRAKIGTRVRQKSDWNLLDPDMLEWYCRSTPFAVFSIKLQEMREMVEPYAAALAAQSHTPDKLAVMEQAHAAMIAATDVEAWVRADLRFHRSILDACGNELMTPLGALIAHMLEALLLVNAKRAGRFNASLAEHTRVLEAIRRRDGAQARAALELLLGVSRTRLAGRGTAANMAAKI